MARPVAVAVDLPRLELDRPFTYLLPDDLDAPVGSLVSVSFHRRTVHGWVLGETDDVPPRVLKVRRVLSRRPAFDERGLRLFEWVRDRYVVPLSVAIDRAIPPRVASEEESEIPGAGEPPPGGGTSVLRGYEGGPDLLRACRGGDGLFALRPLPDDEGPACVEAVRATLAGGRDAVVIVPEVDPLPATAAAALEAAGPAGILFAGGDRRERYRMWLDILGGRYRVVVGSRAAVFALVPRPGLLWVHREAHAAHREERTPAHHSGEVAAARARLEGAVCVLSGLAPSAATAAMIEDGLPLVRAPRGREREAAPLVELTPPAREDRSPRLAAMLRDARGGFLLLSRRGYGVARVCRSCGEPARCDACAGPLVARQGRVVCAVCARDPACPSCGGRDFGVERGGAERVAEWARNVTSLPVTRAGESEGTATPGADRVVVGTAAAVKDVGPARTALVGVLDADRARRRAGLDAPEQVLATWFEAAAWAGPRRGGGRVLVQTREAGDPAVQALVRWDPLHFHRRERERRVEAGFPPGFPVFRVLGSAALPAALESLGPVHLLATSLGDQAVCLTTLRPEAVPGFRARILELVAEDVVTRVEAEPRL